jgi:hypothetical protein
MLSKFRLPISFFHKVVCEWTEDAVGLVKLAESYVGPSAELALDNLFEKEQAGVLKVLQEVTTFKRVSNCSRFLSNWAKLLKTINGDGCGSAFFYGRARFHL